jgi:hypothetical protein
VHPTRHRGLRELYAFTRRVAVHHARLATRLDGFAEAAAVLDQSRAAAEQLLAELREITPERDLYGSPAAQGVGTSLGGATAVVGDRFLERNQAVRLAVGEVQHLTTLLAYLRIASEREDDQRVAAFCAGWAERLGELETSLREAAARMAVDPDAAIRPLDGSLAGRAGHAAANAIGTVGEWVDRRLGAGHGR